RGARVLAIDPGFRTGSHAAALDEQGNVLDHAVIHPHGPSPHRDVRKGKPEAKAEEKPVAEAQPSAAPPAAETNAPTAEPAPAPAEAEAAAPAPAPETPP